MTEFIKTIFLSVLCLSVGFLNAYTPLVNVQVVDGDTIRAEADGREIKIRLVEIDAPEMNQPFGAQSKNFLDNLLHEKKITLISEGQDRYGRVLGNLFSDEMNVNMLMVKYGFAWVYDRYATNLTLYEYQDEAKEQRLGLWRSKNPIPPWVWRRKK